MVEFKEGGAEFVCTSFQVNHVHIGFRYLSFIFILKYSMKLEKDQIGLLKKTRI